MNLRRVELTVYADNEAAHNLYRKFGFEVEGRLRDYALRDGVFVDTLSMARCAHWLDPVSIGIYTTSMKAVCQSLNL